MTNFKKAKVIYLLYFSRYLFFKFGLGILFESGGHNSKMEDKSGMITLVSIGQAKFSILPGPVSISDHEWLSYLFYDLMLHYCFGELQNTGIPVYLIFD